MENKSFEQMAEDVIRKIRDNKEKIIEDFYFTYAANLIHLGKDFSLEDICLNEQLPSYRDGNVVYKYWFELKPKFDSYVAFLNARDIAIQTLFEEGKTAKQIADLVSISEEDVVKVHEKLK